MHWLRSALLYLFLVSLLIASIWIFWGDLLWQKRRTVSAQEQKPLPVPARRISKEHPQPGKEARQHAASVFVALAQSIAEDNRQHLARATALYEKRNRELLANLGLVKGELSPTQPNSPAPPPAATKTQPSTAKAGKSTSRVAR